MQNQNSLSTHIYHFVYTLMALPRAIEYIQEKKLWRGIDQYGWVIRALVVVGVGAGLYFLINFLQWTRELDVSDPVLAMSSMGGLVSNAALESYDLFTAGFMKYVVLFMLEVLVFHFMRRALADLVGRESGIRFVDFWQAQRRMFIVVLRSWIFEFLITLVIGIVFGIFDTFSFLETVLIFGVQCYFLGFAIVDNYNEQFGLSIKESIAYSRNYTGICLGLGLALYVLMLIPLVGSLAGPIIVSVAAALVMVRMTDLHHRADQPLEAYGQVL